MIKQLCGKLIDKQPPWLVIDVQGVGYSVQAPLSTCFGLPEVGNEVILKTHLIVREDAWLLFGFLTESENQLFQEIIKVNGVGPKVALAILSGLSPLEFAELVRTQSPERLERLPGIGSKTAQRIVVEMQGRLAKWALSAQTISQGSVTEPAASASQEAIEALIALGYKPQEATRAVKKVAQTELGCAHILKEALQGLARV